MVSTSKVQWIKDQKSIILRGRSRTAATSKMECFVIIVNGWKLPAVNYYHKTLHLGCCSSPRSASERGELQYVCFLKIHQLSWIWISSTRSHFLGNLKNFLRQPLCSFYQLLCPLDLKLRLRLILPWLYVTITALFPHFRKYI